MLYVFDTNSLIVTGYYFPDRFPTFWRQLDDSVAQGRILSVREVKRELENGNAREHLAQWVLQNAHIFRTPTQAEMTFVREVFAVPRFLEMVHKKQVLRGMPVADPFVIAAAKVQAACVVSEEAEKPDSARIPNVCLHFGVPCTNLEGFMEREGWSF